MHLYQLLSPELEAGKCQMLAGMGHIGSINWGSHPGGLCKYLVKLDIYMPILLLSIYPRWILIQCLRRYIYQDKLGLAVRHRIPKSQWLKQFQFISYSYYMSITHRQRPLYSPSLFDTHVDKAILF